MRRRLLDLLVLHRTLHVALPNGHVDQSLDHKSSPYSVLQAWAGSLDVTVCIFSLLIYYLLCDGRTTRVLDELFSKVCVNFEHSGDDDLHDLESAIILQDMSSL